MIINSLIKLNKGRTKICLDNGTDFCLYRAECDRFNIEEGNELSAETYDLIAKEILIPRCKKRGLHLLEKQDRTEANLRKKLSESGYPDEIVDIAIDYINSFGYIDDERMARSHIRFYQSTRSKQRIKQDLINKGVHADIIEICIEEEYECDETELIRSLLDKKGYDSDNATYESRAKMYRFLAGRGFSIDSINKALKN